MGKYQMRRQADPMGRPTTVEGVEAESAPWKVLLVDDDPSFGKILSRAAGLEGIDLRSCASLRDLASEPDINQYDLVLVDYHLGFTTGTRLSAFLSLFYSDVPVAIVSGSSYWWLRSGANWSTNVRTFIHKERDVGAFATAVKQVIKSTLVDAGERFRGESEPEYLNSRVEYIAPRDRFGTRAVMVRGAMGAIGRVLLKVRSLL